jgi:hypothetical protein
MLLFYVQVLNQVAAESQRSKGDAVVRQSYLGFLEATSALMFAASLTYSQTAAGSVVGSITDASGDLYLTRKSLLPATFRDPKCGVCGTNFEGPDRPTESSCPLQALNTFRRGEQ